MTYEWLLELKYLKQSESRRLEAVKKEGLRQLDAYAAHHNATVRQALLVLIGKGEIIVVER